MPRPQRKRRICREPAYYGFSPDDPTGESEITMSVDEFEVVRLVDLEKRTHEQCARQMDISRTTVTEIYESAREKIAAALVERRRLVIAGGSYRLCEGGGVCGNPNCHCAENGTHEGCSCGCGCGCGSKK